MEGDTGAINDSNKDEMTKARDIGVDVMTEEEFHSRYTSGQDGAEHAG